ncbi:MAG: galactitol-1-phosphate 5-dehydrogenase [Cyclobacteriaceae bacterium]|nr:galactitol-1-phosphate 5-dehydrogenase [Cyclobacteriaceae bacterium]
MNNTMQAAVLYAPGDIRIEQTEMPRIDDDKEVIVQLKAVGICGSDIDRIMKSGTYSFPMIPGHELSGVVILTGNKVGSVIKGDRVVVAPLSPCLKCEFCLRGNYGLCDKYDFIGSRSNGGFAQYLKTYEENLLILPEKISFVEGACVEPAAVTMHGIKKIDVWTGTTVAVLGCGTLGCFAVQMARIMGAKTVIAVDIDGKKLGLADCFGADYCINGKECDVVEEIAKITAKSGVDVAVESAGQSITQEQCLLIAKKGGSVLYLGTAGHKVCLSKEAFNAIVRYELSIKGSWNSYSSPFPGDEWTSVLKLLEAGKLKINALISHRFKLNEAPEVFAKLHDKKLDIIKAVFIL